MISNLSGKNLIMTSDGLMSISNIKAGDMLLDSDNEFVEVIEVAKGLSPLVSIKGHGHPELEVGKDVEILTTNYKRVVNKETGKTEREFHNPIWEDVGNVEGSFWASPIMFREEKIPTNISEDMAWILGSFLAIGHIRGNRLYFPIKHSKEDELAEKLNREGLRLLKEKKGSIYEYYAIHAVIVDWIKDNFNKNYGEKNIPYWAYGMKDSLRKAFFDGFIWGVGTFENNNYRFSVKDDKHSAIGMKLIAQSLGYSTALYLSRSGKKKDIERWQIVAELSARSSVVIEDNRYGLIREVLENNRRHIVYSIKLKGNKGIIVDGIIVR